jgi:hypothetical protein
MTDKINDFLKETELKNVSKGWGVNSIGAMLMRAGAKPVIALVSVKSTTDQILISANREVVLGPVARLVGIEGGVVSGVFNLESSGVEALDWRPRHDEQYHEA